MNAVRIISVASIYGSSVFASAAHHGSVFSRSNPVVSGNSYAAIKSLVDDHFTRKGFYRV